MVGTISMPVTPRSQNGWRLIERNAEPLGNLGRNARVVRAGIQYQAERALFIDPHRRPNSADSVAKCGRNETGFGCSNHQFRKIVLRIRRIGDVLEYRAQQ